MPGQLTILCASYSSQCYPHPHLKVAPQFDPIGTCFLWRFHWNYWPTQWLVQHLWNAASALSYLNVCLFTKLICWNCCSSIRMPADKRSGEEVLHLSHIPTNISGIILISSREETLFETILLKKKVTIVLSVKKHKCKKYGLYGTVYYNLPVG